jgi:DNA-binding response OmpR family regulator
MSGHVLVTDDDRDLCELLALELGQRGFEVTWKTSAAEALDLVATEEIDVALTSRATILQQAGVAVLGQANQQEHVARCAAMSARPRATARKNQGAIQAFHAGGR